MFSSEAKAGGGNRLTEIKRTSMHKRIVCEEFVLERGNLRVNHAIQVQLSAAGKSNVLRRIRKRFRLGGILKCRHQDEQCI